MKYKTFPEFYGFYLSQHLNPTCRALHVLGTSLSIVWLSYTIATHRWPLLPLFLLIGYGFSWIGHFGFERNKPAAFKQPVYSFMGDLRMCFEVLTLQRRINERGAKA